MPVETFTDILEEWYLHYPPDTLVWLVGPTGKRSGPVKLNAVEKAAELLYGDDFLGCDLMIFKWDAMEALL